MVFRQLATEPTRHKFNQLATQLEATRHIRNVNSPQRSQLATQ